MENTGSTPSCLKILPQPGNLSRSPIACRSVSFCVQRSLRVDEGPIELNSTLRFVWFWTFWHWSTEGFRSGALLRSPVQGIGSHWDEWFTHEASDTDRQEIESLAESDAEQCRFISWLARRWAAEATWRGSAPPIRYVLNHLARVAPFDRWRTFDAYRASYGSPGISAIIIDEKSDGEAADVRHVESLILPADEDSAAHDVVPEGFQSEASDLSNARQAAMSMFSGRGFLVLLGLWIVAGRRPYPRWLRISLLVAWVTLAGLIVDLLVGFDPGNRLELLFAVLTGLWLLLAVTGLTSATLLGSRGWLAGREWRNRLELAQTRLRIDGGLALQGGSAGLPFCLNTLLATYRSRPQPTTESWLWDQVFRNLRHAGTWAATGIVSAGGGVEGVALEPKVRASIRHSDITDLVTPWQTDARQSAVDRVVSASVRHPRPAVIAPGMTRAFAWEKPKLRVHRSRHVAQAVMAIGRLGSRAQLAANVFALAVSLIMLAALPDIRNVLAPPPAPAVVTPASPSPYYLWVSLDTKRPRAFQVAMESDFWANRRTDVTNHSGPDGSARAEILLSRAARQATIDEEEGTLSIERRRAFLSRDYEPGERVGSYSLSYITNLGHDKNSSQ